MSIPDVRETGVSQTIYPVNATPGVAIANLNNRYLLKGMPVQQVTTVHATNVITPGGPVPTNVLELVGRQNDISRGLPQGAIFDGLGGLTLPAF